MREMTEYKTNSGGFLHCEDGPALIRGNGAKEWWINGMRIKSQQILQEKLELTDEEMLAHAIVNGSFS